MNNNDEWILIKALQDYLKLPGYFIAQIVNYTTNNISEIISYMSEYKASIMIDDRPFFSPVSFSQPDSGKKYR